MTKYAIAALAALLSVVAMAQVDPARTVLVVNGDEIKGDEYYRRMEFLPGVGKRMGNQIAEFPPGFLTIEQLVTERLLFQLARQKGLYPSDVEVQAELKSRLDDTPNLLELWKSSGRTEDELRYQARVELTQFKLQTDGITITDQQVEKYYNENPETYTIPKQYKLRVIVVDSAEAKAAVDKELAAGKSFAEVATARSLDVSKANGGDFGTIPETMFAPPMRNSIQKVKIGQVSEWVGSEQDGVGRYARFLVENIVPAKKMELDANLKRRIRREMMLRGGRIKNDVEKEMREMRAKAKLDIRNPEFAQTYKAYIEAYLKQRPGN